MKNIVSVISEPKDKIRSFIINNFYIPNASDLHNDMSLFDTGIIDSTGVMELIVFIEKEFDIRVDDIEVVQSNFDCVDKILDFIKRKKHFIID